MDTKVIGLNFIALGDELGAGAFRYIHLIIRHLENYELYNVSFVVYKQEQISEEYIGIPEKFSVKYINVPRLGKGLKRIVFEQTLFYKYIVPCDVFYSYCSSLPLFVKARKIFTLHDVYSFVVKGRFSFVRKIYLQGMTRLYVKAADKIITVSQNSKDDIQKYLGVREDKIVITYNFILKPTINPCEKLSLTNKNNEIIDLDKPFFLYVGSLHNGKNIKGMCESFAKFCNTRNDYSLIIVGKILENQETYLDFLHSHPNIYYVGYQSRNVVETLLNKCYATVLLSFYEGFGIPPLEGFYYHKPAIVSKTSSLPEVVGKAGVYVDPYSVDDMANGFSNLIDHYDECKSHIGEQLRKFSPEEAVENFMDVLGISYTRQA